MYRKAYNEVMTSLLVRKRKVQDVSVVNVQFRNGFHSDLAFMRFICRAMKRAGHAEVIIYLNQYTLANTITKELEVHAPQAASLVWK